RRSPTRPRVRRRPAPSGARAVSPAGRGAGRLGRAAGRRTRPPRGSRPARRERGGSRRSHVGGERARSCVRGGLGGAPGPTDALVVFLRGQVDRDELRGGAGGSRGKRGGGCCVGAGVPVGALGRLGREL